MCYGRLCSEGLYGQLDPYLTRGPLMEDEDDSRLQSPLHRAKNNL
jgi:hypothetical protein